MENGTHINITTKKGNYEGIVMPSSTKETLILKLSSGYNLGVNRKEITKTKILPFIKTEETPVSMKTQSRPGLKNVLILHTGGTLASKVSYQTGGVISRFTPEDILTLFPEVKTIANIHTHLIRNMFSEDMRFAHYNLIAKELVKQYDQYDAFIITHGTDTLHYTAAALTFMLEHLGKPIILVGAQRSSDRGSSDAALNLVSALHFATKSVYHGVAICMHESTHDNTCVILPSLHTRKMHTSRRDAFQAINQTPIARVSRDGTISFLQAHQPAQPTTHAPSYKPFKENLKIAIITSHPNFMAAELNAYKTFDGLILAGTGLGHFPVNTIDKETKEHTNVLKTLTRLAKKMPVIMTSQCIYGRVNMNVYDSGHKIQQAGVLGNLDDTPPETVFIKLAYLLSTQPKKKIMQLYKTNARGEHHDRTPYQDVHTLS